MDWNTEPTPLHGAPASKAKWRVASVLENTVEIPLVSDQFLDVALNRRTVRNIEPATDETVCAIVKSVFRAQAVRGAHERMQKAMVSAGALHTVDALICGRGLPAPLVFDDQATAFLELAVSSRDDFDRALTRLESLVPSARGHVIVYAANLKRIHSAYDAPYSLIFRDAGAVDQLLSMMAFASGLAFVPLGTLANDLVYAIRGDSDIAGVGCGMLGRPIE